VNVPLDTDTAIVIGAGNVAMDVARMLALEPSELDATDTADHAIAELKKSNIRKVYICARRGAENAAFTSPELRDLPKLEHTNVIMNKSDIDAAITAAGDAPEKDVKSNLDAMLAIAEQEKTSHARTMEFLFHHVPTEIKGSGRVQEVVFKTPSGEKTIKSGLVISAIGYEAVPLNGVTYEKGRVLNSDGRVNDNLYVVGWAKRGPSGVIGTNKSDAAAVIDLLIADLNTPKSAGDIKDLIGAHKVITQSHWEAINAAEVASGEPLGKPRVKVADKSELLRLGGL
jgi:ferredoxin--NADP+ reductase